MTNIGTHPNHVHLAGDVVFGTGFGVLVSCRPVNLSGIGHHAHVEARFRHGLRIELDRQTAAEFARALTESVNALPPLGLLGGDCSGIVAELGDI